MISSRFKPLIAAIGFLPVWAIFVVGCIGFVKAQAYLYVYNYAETIAILSLIVFIFISGTDVPERRPWTWVPPEGAWWEYIVFGIASGIVGLSMLVPMFGTFVVLPILVPFKVFREYVFGPNATLLSAVVAVPVTAVTTGFLFMIVYLVLLVKGRGSMSKDGRPIFENKLGQGWPIADVFHFSLATMVEADTPLEPSGWCRWVALLQAAITKVIEVIVVAIGVTLIIERLRH